jgi:Cu/Ag efflux protein CusF
MGVVKGLPGSGRAQDEILVKHQPIPDYRDPSTGKVTGMHAMTMPFYVAPGVSLDGISVGDQVELKVEQHREPQVSERVVALVKVR